ncbi:MAG: DUF707 domain-containing protein [Chromatiaceae bacterium]|nr:DUF707 domain-containing protein [Chromatiaceae bacterium]
MLHYVCHGAAAGWDPSPLFDVDTYLQSHREACTRETALRHFSDCGKSVAPGAYRSREVLVACQKEYMARTHTELLRDECRGHNRFAVFLQCGKWSVHQRWLSPRAKNWDLIVNHYDSTHLRGLPYTIEFMQQGTVPGTKITALNALLQRWPEMLARYDYILFLDDDIELTETDISVLFARSEQEHLDLLQPSLSPESYACHTVFRTTGANRSRLVNGVEVMMPVLSRGALLLARELIGQSISGWGWDLALAKLVSLRLRGRAAVADDIIAIHNKSIDLTGGTFYRMLVENNIFPMLEYRYLRQRYATDAEFFNLC